ncbi:MAG: glycosyltransferase [Burkholderiales bacterium]|nr:glycosyltransferase [Nitrosomonas sp.]MCP5274534.1 glycosyltransferase [Burkholderiales bacterium]
MSDYSQENSVCQKMQNTGTDEVDDKSRVGILLKRYPKLSETFILNEILGLEKHHTPLHIFSLYQPTDSVCNPAVMDVKAPVTILENEHASIKQIVRSHVKLARRNPWRYLGAIKQVMLRNESNRLRDFLHAELLVDKLIFHNIKHLHTHFIAEPASVAEIACRLAGIPFSISAHAKDIYLSSAETLARKLKAASFTVTCTDYNKKHLQVLADQNQNVHRMYHGIDLKIFDEAYTTEAKPSAPPLIMSVGRLREKKGFPTLIAACKHLLEMHIDFQCVIAGYGPDRDRLQAQIDELGLQAHIALAGKLPHQEILRLYKQATIFTLPCQIATDGDRDGIPNVLLEAMAMRLPVVSTNISGVPEVITEGINGYLVQPKDADALANALKKLLLNPSLCQQFGTAGRLLIEKEFSISMNLQRLISLLQQSIDNSMRVVEKGVQAHATK